MTTIGSIGTRCEVFDRLPGEETVGRAIMLFRLEAAGKALGEALGDLETSVPEGDPERAEEIRRYLEKLLWEVGDGSEPDDDSIELLEAAEKACILAHRLAMAWLALAEARRSLGRAASAAEAKQLEEPDPDAQRLAA